LLVFEHGHIAEEGTHTSLIRRKGGIYRGLFERQALELTRGIAREGLVS
jgi:ATP-binding cassette subfamily B protein